MTLQAYLSPGQAPRERPPRASMTEATQDLHQRVDIAARAHGHPYLHPEGATVQVDVLGSSRMVAWQEQKTERVMGHTAAWSNLPQLYARYGTESGRALIAALNDLEAARGVVLTDSGMQAAALTFDALLVPQAHALISRQVYNKTKTYLTWLADRMNLSLGLLDEVTPETLRQNVRPETGLVFAETYTNPLLRAVDPQAVGNTIVGLQNERAPNLRLVIDNTIATPWGVKTPLLNHPGVTAIAASGTKALGGNDRDMWGYIASNDVTLINRVMDLQAMRGGIASWRIAEAVAPRLAAAAEEHQRRCASAAGIATFLHGHPGVEEVFHPSLPTHPDHVVYQRCYTRPGSFVSFRLRDTDEEGARHFCDVLATTEVVRYALSFDGWVTKVNHHKTVSEFHTPDGVLRRQGIDRIVRLALGLEDPQDIMACLNWALCHHRSVSPQEIAAWQTQRHQALVEP